jgi:RhoGEF domain
VRGLQELVDIYVTPASVPVNVLTGAGKETVIPTPERKMVFGGLDSLFSFHKESFLPALEAAAAPLMRRAEEVAEADKDGKLSLNVARVVANSFVSHAAFMRMYSSYIK